LRDALAERQCLAIVDDVWSTAAAQAFAAVGPRGRVLYTTRDERVLHAVHAEVQRVDVLPDAAARQLLSAMTGTAVDALPPETDEVLRATGRVALALALVGAAVGRGGRSWRHAAEELKQGTDTFLDHPYANTFKAMQVAVGALDDDLAHAYESLAVYPEDTHVPLAAVARYWSWLWGADVEWTRSQLAVLAGRGLLSFSDAAIGFHDLQRDFLLLQLDDLALPTRRPPCCLPRAAAVPRTPVARASPAGALHMGAPALSPAWRRGRCRNPNDQYGRGLSGSARV
jgi:hypothetical protein